MKRMKILQNLVKVSLIALVIVISINFTGGEKTQELVSEEPQSKVEQVDQFLNELKKLRENSEKSKEYFEIIDKLAVLVKEEVKRNPERMESFLEDMIGIAVKVGPGLALEVEYYANTSLKKEMERLKKESSAFKLLEKEKQIKTLEEKIKEVDRLQKELAHSKQEKDRLEEKNNSLSFSNRQLQSELAQAEKFVQEKDRKEKTIIGKWEEINGVETIEFFKEGIVIIIDERILALAGDYRFINDNRIRIDLKSLGKSLGPIFAKISTSKEEINLTTFSGKLVVYRKQESPEWGPLDPGGEMGPWKISNIIEQ